MNQTLEQWTNLHIAMKTLVLVFLWGLVVSGYYFMYYQDQENSYRMLLVQFKNKRKERTKYQTTAQNLPLWKEEVKRLEEERKKAQTLLPTAKEIPTLLRKLDSLANKSGLEITVFNPLRTLRKRYYEEVPTRMAASGTFYELMVFFDKVSHLDRIVNISGFNLNNPMLRNQKIVLQSSFMLTTYRYVSPIKKPVKGRRR
ncbi:MAG: type 4a pilus biogenesis protein PilO [Myxococcales bacterium]|nr:type 4a pilus biogenesis protein PilO [Myxococcales bacterium]MCB9643427.1 type 4a pilus biogenesis protein PilO [Myxococcales bacterium]